MPKKILFFCGGSYVFGKEIVTLNLLEELYAKGVQIHCIVNGWNNGDFIQRLKVIGITYDEVKLGFFYLKKPFWTLDSLLHYPSALFQIRNVLKAFNPDILYFYSERTMVSVYPLIKNKDAILHLNEPIANSKLNRFIINNFPGSRLTYVVCSKFILSKLAQLVPVEQQDVHVIYNAIEVRERAEKNSDKEDIHIGVVGQLRHHKGQDILIRALAKLKAWKFKLSIYGSGEKAFEDELKQLMNDLDVSERIEFKGFEKNIDIIYANLDIVVVPSRSEEPFGLVAIEPAQWKIPVIVSKRGGLPEVVQDGVTGLVFESENVDVLAEKLLLLFENSDLRITLGTNALERANLLFDKKVMGDAFYNLI